MSDNPDFRVSSGVFDHPKFVRLEALHGAPAALGLFRLWSWVRRHRPNGDLTGMEDAEIDHVCGRGATAGATALKSLGFLDGEAGARSVHGWQEHNGWASASAARTLAGRVAAMVKQCRRIGLTPDAYLDAQGGVLAGDAAIRASLNAAFTKPPKNGQKVRRSATACADRVRPQVPLTESVPDPAPNGGGGRRRRSAAGLVPSGPPASRSECSADGCTFPVAMSDSAGRKFCMGHRPQAVAASQNGHPATVSPRPTLASPEARRAHMSTQEPAP